MSYRKPFHHYFVTAALALTIATANAADTPGNLNTAEIERLTGLKGTYSKEENVFKVSQPRTDVKTQVDKWAMATFHGVDLMGRLYSRQRRTGHDDGRHGAVRG